VKVCVSVAEETTAAVLARMGEQLPHADLFEVRADFVRDLDLRALLAARARPLLLTCRPESEGGRWPDADAAGRRRILAEAVELGFDYVDVEARAGFDEIVAAKAGRGLVLSWHDFEGTPDGLDALYGRMAAQRPDVVKIAVRARSAADLGRLLAFARRCAPAPGQAGPALVAIAMGPEGTASRVLGGRYGAPFTFAAPTSGRATAPGQLPARALVSTYRVGAIGPATRVYGVLGRDVLRSLSPAIHNRAFAALGVDAVYVPLQAESLDAFLRALPALGLSGFSVTRPYKQAILPHLASVAQDAARAGSVNTVVVQDGALAGTSTDGEGVLRPLRRRLDPAGRAVVILGAGGAARAAAFALVAAGARVHVAARRPEQAAELAQATGATALPSLDAAATLRWDVLLNATPLGSGALPGGLPVPAAALRRGAVVFDMVYEPRETPLLAAARAGGCVAIDGVEMLVAQAVGQLEAWLGQAPPQPILTQAALAAIAEARA
jgi:3-dehydroquinate dehydratase/shikimate dehydrogenase